MSKANIASSAAVVAINLGATEQEARMAPRGPKPDRFHLHLPSAAIHALKVRAAEQGVTAAQVVLNALKHAGVL
ncbi:MAG: hypothetical protein NDI58_03200 [Geothrix sp.]|nr:hypothetical protein [Geothrix sp.]